MAFLTIWKFLRVPNLLLVVFTQVFVFVFLLYPHLKTYPGTLSMIQVVILGICTTSIAAAGYVINNIFDRNIDSFQSEKGMIPNPINLASAWMIYGAMVLIGFFLSYWLAIETNQLGSLYFFPLASGLLAIYAVRLKCSPILGNLLVAAFTAGVILIIPYANADALNLLRTSDPMVWFQLMYRLLYLSMFAFTINFIREIIKDIEDHSFDVTVNCQTTAVYFGVNKSAHIALTFWFVHLVLWLIHFKQNGMHSSWPFIIGLIIFPIAALSYLGATHKQKNHLSLLSLGLKLYMFLGLIYWCLCN